MTPPHITQEQAVAKLRQPARTFGLVFGNKTYVYPEAALDLGQYDPLTDPYYADTAYTGMQSPDKVYANLNNDQDYPRKKLPRIDYYPQIKGDDYIATSVEDMWRTRPLNKSDKGFLPIRDSNINRQMHAHQIEYLGSRYNAVTKLYFLASFGYLSCTFLTLFTVLAGLITFYIGDTHTFNDFIQSMLIVPMFMLGGFVLWKGSVWIAGKLPDNKYQKLKRRTGMVCFPQRGKKPDVEIPFAEFEPRLFRRSSPSGFYHSLAYVDKTGKHRFFAGCNRIGDVYTYAAYLEQFMDITKPLPDIPPLEWCRDKDPTTAAYDKMTGRDPNYWRKKPFKEIKKIREKHKTKIKSIIGECAYRL